MASPYILPVLVGDAAGGAAKEWSAEVRQEENSPTSAAVVTIRFGQRGGKMQTTERRYVAGKNVGKSNETTPFQQAIQETNRRWLNKQQKEGYRREAGEAAEEDDGRPTSEAKWAEGTPSEAKVSAGPGAHDPPLPKRRRVASALLPMLAKAFDPGKIGSARAKTIAFPCLSQPKLDGLRCLIYRGPSDLVAQSRVGGKFTTVTHILEELRPVFDAWEMTNRIPGGRLVLDGELFTFDAPFETLVGALKRDSAAPCLHAAFHAYDMFVLDDEGCVPAPCEERIQTLRSLLSGPLVNTRVVETRRCGSLEEMRAQFAEFTAAGFEGIMLRNASAPYLLGHRSPDLQKYKEFCEEEFEIVGFAEAEGRDAGTVVFECRTNLADPATGARSTFSVRPRGTYEHRARLLRDAPDLVARGAALTVVYQELSAHNVPRFPVGKDVRDGEY